MADSLHSAQQMLARRADGLVWAGLTLVFLLLWALGWYWSREPALFPVSAEATTGNTALIPGQLTARTLTRVGQQLLDKPGGYLRNDILPPGLLLDDMPSWELGVVHVLRDMGHALHKDMGMSHAQYIEDADLAVAEAEFQFNSNSWLLPATESEYRRGVEALDSYAQRLSAKDASRAVFFSRPAYLRNWLSDVDVRLGSLSTRLNAALPSHAIAVSGERDHAGDVPQQPETGWMDIDNVFYEARGSAWALLHLLKAIDVDFAQELEQRNARTSLRAAIHELEATQETLWSPMVLNGSGFGFTANHSLVMANYLNRAHTDLLDVRDALE